MIAYTIGAMCSGALWAFSGCHVVLADSTARLGSLGVVSIFQDRSKYYEKMGIRFIEVVSTRSPNKRLNPVKGEGLKQTVKMLDNIADVFIDSVAKHYGMTYDQVMINFGQGSVFVGQTAMQQGLCHGLISFEEMLSQLQKQVDPQEIAENAANNFVPIQTAAAGLLTSGPSEPFTLVSSGKEGMLSEDGLSTQSENGEEMEGENEEKTVEFTQQDKESLKMMVEKATNMAEDVGTVKDRFTAYEKQVAEQTQTIEKQDETIQAQTDEIAGLKEKVESQAKELKSLGDQVKALLSDDPDENQELLGGGSTELDQMKKMV